MNCAAANLALTRECTIALDQYKLSTVCFLKQVDENFSRIRVFSPFVPVTEKTHTRIVIWRVPDFPGILRKSPFGGGERSLGTHSLNDRPNLISLSDRASLREIGNKKKIWRKLIVWGVPASQNKADRLLLKTERFLYSQYINICFLISKYSKSLFLGGVLEEMFNAWDEIAC